jgi:hypothetical protein
MSQQTRLKHVEVSQAAASMPTQYHEDGPPTIDLKAWECAETPSRAEKASTKQRQTPGATERSEDEQPPPYPQQHRKRSAADLSNDPERPMKRRSSRMHGKIKRGGFVDWRNIDLARSRISSIPSAGPPRNSHPRLVRRSLSPLDSCESPAMQPFAPYRSSDGIMAERQDFQAGLASAPHAFWIVLICPRLMPARKSPTRSL